MVYFIQSITGGPIKIGYTSGNVRNRLANLQTANASKLIVLATTTIYTEAYLHQHSADLRLSGEWLRSHVRLVAWIVSNAQVTVEGRLALAKAHWFAED